ncbi:hypothetical protein [Kibdelosporangium philippinense]|uniref:hypothetical protein n=1 Tax=Kibdelosporangium philippinense TaxID=211113 RepID=UPI00361838C7
MGIQPVAVVPSRDMMLIADERDEAAVLWMLDEGLKIFADHPRWLSPVPYKADEDGDIVAWQPVPGSMADASVRLAERTLETYEYREQRNRMEKLFRQAGDDLEIAEYEVGTGPDGTARSVTTWPYGQDSLLPYTDDILFPAPSGPFRVSWSTAAEVLTTEWEEALTTPPRRRTLRWPDEQALARLRELSTGV